MAENNTYEEARKKRLNENNQKLQELGIQKISKTLAQLTNSDKKSQRFPKPKTKILTNIVEPRRSSRARNSVPSYRDDVDIDLSPLRKRSRSSTTSWASYLARPLEEVKTATYEERACALKAAEQLQSILESDFPSFVKSMGLPREFCKEHLPKTVTDMVLVDENDRQYEAVFIGQKTGLSGGWRAFALDHKLDDGDALVFELVEPKRFKIYIIRASSLSSQEFNSNITGEEEFTRSTKKITKRGKKLDLQANHVPDREEMSIPQELQPENGMESGGIKDVDSAETSESARRKLQKRGKSAKSSESEKEVALVEEKNKGASLRPRKKPTPKLFRKKT